MPTSINVPIGGCSIAEPVVLSNPPVDDLMITFSYDNTAYDEDHFWPNYHTTK